MVLKELNSDYMLNIYYMTIKVTGDPVDDEDLIFKKSQISMEITEITTESTGQMKFSSPVMWTNVENRFLDIFNVYVKNVVKEVEELELFEVTSVNVTEMTVNFTCTASRNAPRIASTRGKSRSKPPPAHLR